MKHQHTDNQTKVCNGYPLPQPMLSSIKYSMGLSAKTSTLQWASSSDDGRWCEVVRSPLLRCHTLDSLGGQMSILRVGFAELLPTGLTGYRTSKR